MKLFSNFLVALFAILLVVSSSTSVSASRASRFLRKQHFKHQKIHIDHHHRMPSTSSTSTNLTCPCPSSPELCASLTTPLPEQEFYMYQTNKSNFRNYVDKYVTSVAMFGGYDPEMLCWAHKSNIRVIMATDGVPPDQLGNNTATGIFIANAVQTVQDNFWDGINLDFEFPIAKGSPEETYLTNFAFALRNSLKNAIPTASFSIDLAWSTNDIDGRAYQYNELLKICDFVAIMDYDTRSQVFSGPPCYAGPNTPAYSLFEGVQSFLNLPNATPQKLVLGQPWYGYRYGPCLNSDSLTTPTCQIESVPFRGVACSDAAGGQIIFSDIMKIYRNTSLQRSPMETNLTMAGEGSFAKFNYIDGDNNKNSKKQVYSMYFDNPETLREKYAAAAKLKLRGIAIWSVDMIYIDPQESPQSRKDAAEMWEAFSAFKN